MIRQGDVYWLKFPKRAGSAPAGRRPAVVVQCDAINETAISTVVVAAVTSNMRYRRLPTSVVIMRKEAGLSEDSLVNSTLIRTVDRSDLGECIGRLPPERMRETLEALRTLFGMR